MGAEQLVKIPRPKVSDSVEVSDPSSPPHKRLPFLLNLQKNPQKAIYFITVGNCRPLTAELFFFMSLSAKKGPKNFPARVEISCDTWKKQGQAGRAGRKKPLWGESWGSARTSPAAKALR